MKEQFTNPLLPCADPFILLHDGKYYLYGTTKAEFLAADFATENEEDDGVRVFESDNLRDWTYRGFCLKKGDMIGTFNFWAPEIVYRNGKFYMVYVAEEHLGIAVADSPLGPFVQEKKEWLSERKAIDGSFFFDDDGKAYLYYVRLRPETGNTIFVAKMSDDLLSIDEENELMLIRAQEEWETKDSRIAEGPYVLKHQGLYYLTYSANHTRSQDYAVGYAVGHSPLGPFERYAGNPILHRTDDMVGTGHHSFTTSKDGQTLICVYHCHTSSEVFHPRLLCLDKAEFVPDPQGGIDTLVIHGPTKGPQPLLI